MRAVVTGATGLLGGNLALELLKQGHHVRATKRGSSRVDHLGDVAIEWVEGDLADEDALARAFDGADVVFHCAAAVSILPKVTPTLLGANVEGTSRVIRAVRRAGAGRLVHCSSTVAVGLGKDGVPATEDSPWNFAERGLDDGYCVTKRQAEERVVAAVAEGLDAVVVNPAFMFGPYDSKPSSGTLIVELLKGVVPGYTPGCNNFVDVRDVARGMILAGEKGRRGERYILGNRNLTYGEIFALIAGVAGVRPPRLQVPWVAARVAGWAGDLQERLTGREGKVNSNTIRWSFERDYIVSSDKATRELGYAPGPVEKGVEDAIAWFKLRGMV